jgi:hypothetical protein
MFPWILSARGFRSTDEYDLSSLEHKTQYPISRKNRPNLLACVEAKFRRKIGVTFLAAEP